MTLNDKLQELRDNGFSETAITAYRVSNIPASPSKRRTPAQDEPPAYRPTTLTTPITHRRTM